MTQWTVEWANTPYATTRALLRDGVRVSLPEVADILNARTATPAEEPRCGRCGEIKSAHLDGTTFVSRDDDYYDLRQIRAVVQSVNDQTSWGVRRDVKKRIWKRLRGGHCR